MARRDRVHCRTSRPARTRWRAKPLSAPPTPANARGAKLEDGLVRRRCGSWRFPQYWRPRDSIIGPEAARPAGVVAGLALDRKKHRFLYAAEIANVRTADDKRLRAATPDPEATLRTAGSARVGR